METPLLIGLEDFKPYKIISQNLAEGVLDTYVLEAQDLDLKKELGDEFYYDILKNRTEADYVALLDGEEYTDLANVDRTFTGLKRALVYYTAARMSSFIDVHSTASGFVVKTGEFTQPISESTRAKLNTNRLSIAIEVMREAALYLDAKRAAGKFEKWRAGVCSSPVRRSSMTIGKIGGIGNSRRRRNNCDEC